MKNSDHNIEIDWALLAKYLSNEATPEEKHEAETWIDANEENKNRFIEVKTSLELAKIESIDINQAWNIVQSKMKPEAKVSILPLIYRIAASFLIITVALFYLFRTPNQIIDENGMVIVKSDNQTMLVNLPDGSSVHLNKKSSLTYPSQFDSTRQVTLSGEGFFEVAKNGYPFIVSTKKLIIEVLGTSFNVNAFNESQDNKIEVKTGIVAVKRNSPKSSESIILEKKQMATLNIASDSLYKSDLLNENHNYWMTGVIEFNRSPLSEVMNTLSRTYDVKITFQNPSIKNCLLTARFENKSFDEIKDILISTYNIKIKVTQQGNVIYGNGCN